MQINVYTFSILNKYKMDSKVAQKRKVDNHYYNINYVYKMVKTTLMYITELQKFDENILSIIKCY